MDEKTIAMAVVGGLCSLVSALIGQWLGRRLGHLEAVGAIRCPASTDKRMLEAKEATNFTMQLCGLKEID